MTPAIRIRLSAMMFLQYFIWGCWYVTLGTYLMQNLQYGGVEVGLAYGTFALSAMISPFFVGMIADRFFAAERVIGVLHIVGALLLFVISRVTDFSLFYVLILVYNLCYAPTIALTNSISFHQMQTPGEQFPAIRVFGTIGWIIAGLTIGFLRIETSPAFFELASVSSLIMGVYSFSLPHVAPVNSVRKRGFAEILGLDALKLMKERSFAVLMISSVLICIPLMFYYSFTNPFLHELGVVNAAGKMTLGQMSEIIFLLIMPFFFRRMGTKNMILIGMLAWIIRYFLFAYGDGEGLVWMLYAGILLHGICYDFFFVTGQIFVDNKAPANLRSSAQGLITFATYGLGFFIGTIVSGKIVDVYAYASDLHNWNAIWIIPGLLTFVVLLVFWASFREKQVPKAEKTA